LEPYSLSFSTHCITVQAVHDHAPRNSGTDFDLFMVTGPTTPEGSVPRQHPAKDPIDPPLGL